jgi:hypothetical protein
MAPEISYPLALLLGYLLGSIPFGLVLTKLAGTPDLRTIGSGNIGATNVLRTGRKGLAAATLVLDALKGTAAVIIAGYLGGPSAAMLAGLGAFLGHLFPVSPSTSASCSACSGRARSWLARSGSPWRSHSATPQPRRWSRASSRRCSCGGTDKLRLPRCSPCSPCS